jgi:hypothetical protein
LEQYGEIFVKAISQGSYPFSRRLQILCSIWQFLCSIWQTVFFVPTTRRVAGARRSGQWLAAFGGHRKLVWPPKPHLIRISSVSGSGSQQSSSDWSNECGRKSRRGG